jgi:hypothetical protein
METLHLAHLWQAFGILQWQIHVLGGGWKDAQRVGKTEGFLMEMELGMGVGGLDWGLD